MAEQLRRVAPRDLLRGRTRQVADLAPQDVLRVGPGAVEVWVVGLHLHVVLTHMLEYVEDPRPTVESIRECLNPGGTLVVLAPQDPSLYGALDRSMGHKRRFEREQLRDLLTNAGFQVEKIYSLNKIGTPPWWIYSKLLGSAHINKVTLKIFDNAITGRYAAPTSLDDYVRKAQLAQYENVRAQFEAYRRNFEELWARGHVERTGSRGDPEWLPRKATHRKNGPCGARRRMISFALSR